MTNAPRVEHRPIAFREWLGLSAIAMLLVVSTALNLHNSKELTEDARMVAHTYQVKGQLKDVLVSATSSQNAVRAFVHTGDEEFLHRHDEALENIPLQLDSLRRLVADNASQGPRLTNLTEALDQLLLLMNIRVEDIRREGTLAPSRFPQREGEKRMDRVRDCLSAMLSEEDRLLAARNTQRRLSSELGTASLLLSGALCLLMLLLFVRNLYNANAARARAAALAFEQEQWFRTTLGSIGDAVMATDKDGRVTYINRIAQQLTGWSADEAHGHPLEEVFNIVNEDSRLPVENPVEKVRATGRIVGLANHTVLLAKDGKEHPIDDSAAPIHDSDGELIGVVLVFHDVEEQRRNERDVARSEARKSAILRTALDCIITMDHEGRILEFNPAAERTFGHSAQEAIGRPLVDLLIPAQLREAHRNGLRHFLSTGVGPILNKRIETTAMRADGSEFPVELAVTPIAGQQHPMFSAHLRDITERKRMENELRETAARLSESDRRKSEFIAILAHELRNPLSPLRNGLELIAMPDANAETMRMAVPMMERQLGQMVRLIDDLLDVTRISHGKIELRRTPVDLVDLVRQAEEVVRTPCEQAGQKLTVSVPQVPVMVNADPARLVQVMGNLLSNACKFTPRDGQVSIVLEREGQHAVIHVRDSGIGISPENLSTIFTLFTQVEDPLGRKQGGLGIGLTLVRWLVEMHNGTVSATSEGPGKGSEFVVRLPLVMADDPAVEATRKTDDDLQRSLRILVVDDNQDAADSLAFLLRRFKHEVFLAYDGLQGVEQARTHLPDVVLMDIGMPGLNGYEAAARIREIPGMDKALLVALSGWGQEEDRARSAQAGFNAHLVKPADNAKLLALLERTAPMPPRS
ncbi:MAG TPA: PAS domain S-box protein [Flavobacteriales bacterium]